MSSVARQRRRTNFKNLGPKVASDAQPFGAGLVEPEPTAAAPALADTVAAIDEPADHEARLRLAELVQLHADRYRARGTDATRLMAAALDDLAAELRFTGARTVAEHVDRTNAHLREREAVLGWPADDRGDLALAANDGQFPAGY